MKRHMFISAAALCALPLSMTAPLAAENASAGLQTRAAQTASNDALAQFAPAQDRKDHRIDYEHWNDALGWFVVPMGPSIREGARRVVHGLGTRRVYGHESRYRLEGNRVAFSFLTDDIRTSLTDYRKDLERIGSNLDLTRIPRNEQLAFWLNLHNVAVIEALAHEYPLSEPGERTFGANKATLQDAKLVTIKGVELSPRDIREGIVYSNWQDPKVLYGFWRGEIGGPSIQRLAFTGSNVDALLSLSAEEFVNSLRGVDKYNGALRVSRIYEEAAPFYFGNFDALRGHLGQFAREDVKALITKTSKTGYSAYESDIADMARGERDPGLVPLCGAGGASFGAGGLNASVGACSPPETRPNAAIMRLIQERRAKIEKAIERGIRTGMVIYGDGTGDDADSESPPEVE